VIKKQSPGVFAIQHTRDFNPNSKSLISYKNELNANDLAPALAELCEHYYSTSVKNAGPANSAEKKNSNNELTHHRMVHQCKNCLSIYDERYGDELNGIAAGTRFENIKDYICQVCESPKEEFAIIAAVI
jgi:rubredoxin